MTDFTWQLSRGYDLVSLALSRFSFRNLIASLSVYDYYIGEQTWLSGQSVILCELRLSDVYLIGI